MASTTVKVNDMRWAPITLTVRASYPLRLRLRLGLLLFRLAARVIGSSCAVTVECPITDEDLS